MSDLVEVTIVAMGTDCGAWVPVTLSCGHSTETLNFGAPEVGSRCFCTDCAVERWQANRTESIA